MKTTKKIVAAMAAALVCAQAWAVTAIWTGKQEMVQTVTYQMAWRCEYMYAGQYFWRVFKNSCPSSIEVE